MNNNLQLVLKSSTTEMSLNDHSAGIYLTPELDGLTGLPEIRTTSGVNAGYDGGWTSAQKFDARSIVIRGTIANNDKTEVERMRRELVALLAQGKNEQLELDFVTETGRAYEVQVRTIACDMALQKVLTQQDFMITLRADDPLIYDNSSAGEEATVNISGATGGFRIPFEIPLAIDAGSEETLVENTGLEAVAPTVKMYGALHNPKIINHTTNQSMQIQAELGFAEGDWANPSEPVEGKGLSINGAPENALIADFGIKGNTSQNGTPTPDAPIPVQTVTGENVVKICGKNLFDKDSLEGHYFYNSSTYRPNAQNLDWDCSQPIPVESNTTYTISMALKSGENFTNAQVIYWDADKNGVGSAWGNIRGALTTGANVRFITIAYRNATWENVQLELGSTATAYEPYQGQSYEVNLGKNLFDKNNASGLFEGYMSNGKAWSASGYWSYYIPCQPNTTYTASRTNIGNGGRFAIATSQAVPANNVDVAQLTQDNAATSLTITTNSSAKYIIVWFANVNDAGSESLADWEAVQQLEKGSQATSYASYFTPIELCKIGTYQDYIWKDGDTWKIHKDIEKVVLDGVSANAKFIERMTANNSKYRFRYTNSAAPASNYPSGTAAPIWCDMLTGVSMGNTWNNIQGFCYNDVNNSMIASIESLQSSTLEQANTWLASNNMTLYYTLATPTDTEITNEALVAQLEAILQDAKMHNPQTNITSIYAAGNVQATLKVSYFTVKNPDVRDELIIDSRLRTITLNGLDVYHLQAPGSEFLMLAPGENKLSLQSDIVGDNGYAKVSYKQGYLSI